VFSEEIIAGNCEIGEHVINLQDSFPIKQTYNTTTNSDTYERSGVIEESKSP